ncbi:hypothetical protein NDU88_003998 [Pleurodeles waltl]|uniref:Uncharacterized protein n=1 Tax=Pleurodeles waltl TaxID=8319 RepID=A0AAV7V1N1_PLEWA|nr:hypothetical protein NDU88_003998 [Pleurodeles waltl]
MLSALRYSRSRRYGGERGFSTEDPRASTAEGKGTGNPRRRTEMPGCVGATNAQGSAGVRLTNLPAECRSAVPF